MKKKEGECNWKRTQKKKKRKKLYAKQSIYKAVEVTTGIRLFHHAIEKDRVGTFILKEMKKPNLPDERPSLTPSHPHAPTPSRPTALATSFPPGTCLSSHPEGWRAEPGGNRPQPQVGKCSTINLANSCLPVHLVESGLHAHTNERDKDIGKRFAKICELAAGPEPGTIATNGEVDNNKSSMNEFSDVTGAYNIKSLSICLVSGADFCWVSGRVFLLGLSVCPLHPSQEVFFV